jgi:hypothetical protein
LLNDENTDFFGKVENVGKNQSKFQQWNNYWEIALWNTELTYGKAGKRAQNFIRSSRDSVPGVVEAVKCHFIRFRLDFGAGKNLHLANLALPLPKSRLPKSGSRKIVRKSGLESAEADFALLTGRWFEFPAAAAKTPCSTMAPLAASPANREF